MRPQVAVLGCGPAGLLAAHAAVREGCEVDVYSKPVKSRIGGAQFLYIPIPGITSKLPDGHCTIYKLGKESGYATKVYGSADADTSWKQFEDGQEVPVWNMQAAYDRLFAIYGNGVIEGDITPHSLAVPGGVLDRGYDHIIACIPKNLLCISGAHAFTSQEVWITSTPTTAKVTDHWIEYDGRKETEWYRSSCLFGYAGFEYAKKPSIADKLVKRAPIARVSKPLDNNCDCWANYPRMNFMGRYGAWKKGQLIHNAYLGTQEVVGV